MYFFDTTKNTIQSILDRKSSESFVVSDIDLDISNFVGLSLYNAVLFKETQNSIYEQKLYIILENLLDVVQKYPVKVNLIKGLSGVLWLLTYLQKQRIMEVESELINQYQSIIIREMSNYLDINCWSYLKGYIGCLLALPPHVSLYKPLFDLWETQLEKKGKIDSNSYPDMTNLGMPYGILGVLYIANEAILMNKCVDQAQNIRTYSLTAIQDAIIYDKNSDQYRFPAIAEDPYECRTAWCYGELTMAYQLYRTAILTENKKMEENAIRIAEMSIDKLTQENAMIYDTSLLLGSAGNLLLYKCLRNQTGLRCFSKGTKKWEKLTIDILNYHGYKMMNRYTKVLYNDYSVLEGLTGVYLTLYSDDHSWFNFLMMNSLY